MKSTIEKLSTLERKLNIEVPAGEVQAAFDRAFRGIQKQAKIKGFRQGKAPISTVRSVFGDRVRQDVVQDLIQASYSAALKEHTLDPISYPTIEFDPIDGDDDKDFSFSAEFEVRPVVTSVSFDKLKVKKEVRAPSDQRVDAVLEDIRKSRAQTVPLLEDRPAQKGDVAVLDFEGMLLSGPLEGGSAQGHELELGASSFIPGFEEGIEGLRVGQEKSLHLAFPDDYQAKDLAGKSVTFKVKLTGLKRKDVPELTDAFAATLGPYADLQALRDEIRKDLDDRESKRIDEDLRNRVMRALVERNPVDVPKAFHADQKKALVEDLRRRMAQQGLDEAKIEEYRQKWDADFDLTAAYMIRSSILIDAIADEQKIQATSSELDAKVRDHALETGIEASKIREFYADPERKSRLTYQVTEQKVLDFLISKAEVREASRHELEAEAERNEPGRPGARP